MVRGRSASSRAATRLMSRSSRCMARPWYGRAAGRRPLSGPVPLSAVTTRSRLLLLLRKHPGITVTDLAAALCLTGMGVRRHLESLELDGLVERSACCEHRVGRPPNGWRLSAKGLELLPRSYDTFVLQLLED